MLQSTSLYQACSELFSDYPLAVDNCDEDFHSMVLMLRDGDGAAFFMLSRDSGDGSPSYLLRPWRSGGTIHIGADSGEKFPDSVVRAIKGGVPIPRDGSLFGWKPENTVTAMITMSLDGSATFLQPSWAVMPLVGIPKVQWPPFIGERFLGQWFWEQCRSKEIVSLGDLVAALPNTVFWLDTKAILGWDSCVVARDVKGCEGYILPQGRYVYYQALQIKKVVPPLRTLLADGNKIDLASRF